MREINDHKTNTVNDNLQIQVLDEPGVGGANHVYQIAGYGPQEDSGCALYEAYCVSVGGKSWNGDLLPSWETMKATPGKERLIKAWNDCTTKSEIRFQNGPIKEAGVNGVTQEALIAICIDRLRSFQAGQYACRENAIALTHLEMALMWLQKRTLDRVRRGVEGTNAK